MYPAELTLKRMIQRTLYMLKRQYGGTIDIYTLVSSVSNQETGVTTLVKDIVHVDRAVVLPAQITRVVQRSISQISANKMFVVGGTYDAGQRIFIVDHDDAPDLDITDNSYIVYRNRKYEIQSYQEYEFEAGWSIVGRELVGEVPEQIYLLKADNLLNLEGATNASKS
jgi:hypothetical protein